MPVTGSSLVLRCAIDQDGVMRRSDEEAVDVIKMGISRAVVMAIPARRRRIRWD